MLGHLVQQVIEEKYLGKRGRGRRDCSQELILGASNSELERYQYSNDSTSFQNFQLKSESGEKWRLLHRY